ncbi:MAG: hypothetical protein HC918_05985 [Oscillatoriales cyanobacterium SM2_1_8]|nr:hypothetical protein [Oscillatoriales cyanobacterium SM2_1_8]
MNAQGKQHKYRWRMFGLVVGSMAIAQPGWGQSVFPEAGSYSIAPTSINMPAQQFVVYVPDAQQLERVRTVAPDAFVSNLDSGQRVVQIGRFNNENLAQNRVAQMRGQGVGALVAAVGGRSAAPFSTALSSTALSMPSPMAAPRVSAVDPLPGVPSSTVAPVPVTRNATINIDREPIRTLTPQPIPTASPNTIEPVAPPPPPVALAILPLCRGAAPNCCKKPAPLPPRPGWRLRPWAPTSNCKDFPIALVPIRWCAPPACKVWMPG